MKYVLFQKRAYQIKENESEKYIGGYFLANDVSERFSKRSQGNLLLVKSSPSFGPIGPLFSYKDEMMMHINLILILH